MMRGPDREPRTVVKVKHGLYVRAAPGIRLRDKKTERLARKVRDVLTWLEPSDWPTVRAWAELEVLSTQVFAVLRAGHVVNPDGTGRKLLDDYRRLRQTQLMFARELGMTPAAKMLLKAGTRAALDIVSAMGVEPPEDVEAEAEGAADGAEGAIEVDHGAGDAAGGEDLGEVGQGPAK